MVRRLILSLFLIALAAGCHHVTTPPRVTYVPSAMPRLVPDDRPELPPDLRDYRIIDGLTLEQQQSLANFRYQMIKPN
jgi:hypothetical protein